MLMLGPEDVQMQTNTLELSDYGKKRTEFYDFEAKKHSTLILVNKCELMNREIIGQRYLLNGIECHFVSVQRGEYYTLEGPASLQTHLAQVLLDMMGGDADALQAEMAQQLFTNTRQVEEMKNILTGLDRFLGLSMAPHMDYQDGPPLDIRADGLRAASHALSRLAGYTSTEDILQEIFANFCIGK